MRPFLSQATIQRLWFLVIGLYLIVALVFPLGVMLSKSVTTWTFDLRQFEFQISNETGEFEAPPVLALDVNKTLGVVEAEALFAGSDGRLPATLFFPDFNF